MNESYEPEIQLSGLESEIETVFDCCDVMRVRFPARLKSALIQGLNNSVKSPDNTLPEAYEEFWFDAGGKESSFIDTTYSWNQNAAPQVPHVLSDVSFSV